MGLLGAASLDFSPSETGLWSVCCHAAPDTVSGIHRCLTVYWICVLVNEGSGGVQCLSTRTCSLLAEIRCLHTQVIFAIFRGEWYQNNCNPCQNSYLSALNRKPSICKEFHSSWHLLFVGRAPPLVPNQIISISRAPDPSTSWQCPHIPPNSLHTCCGVLPWAVFLSNIILSTVKPFFMAWEKVVHHCTTNDQSDLGISLLWA